MKKIISFIDKEFITKKQSQIQKIEITPKQIGHVFAIQITKFDKKDGKKLIATEGWTLDQAVEFMQERIKDYCKFIKSTQDPKQLQQVKSLITLQDQLENARSLKQTILKDSIEAQKQIAESLNQLSPDQSMLIPGGWRTSHLSNNDTTNNNNATHSNHTMLYEVTRNQNDLFTWRIFNTGAGIKNHRKSKLNTKYETVMELTDIPFKEIIEILNQLIIVQTKDNHHFKDKILQIIYQDCAQKAIHAGARKVEHTNHLQAAQRGGFCNWKAIKDYLKFHLPQEVYQNFKDFIDLQVYKSAEENINQMTLPDNLPQEEKNEFKKELMNALRKKFQKRHKTGSTNNS